MCVVALTRYAAQRQRQQLVAIMSSLVASAQYPDDLSADETVPEDSMQVSGPGDARPGQPRAQQTGRQAGGTTCR